MALAQGRQKRPRRAGVKGQAGWQLHQQATEVRPQAAYLRQKSGQQGIAVAQPDFVGDGRTPLDRTAENRRPPTAASLVLSIVTGMSCTSCAKAVYECAIWNSEADRP